VIRIVSRFTPGSLPSQQLCHVLTLGGDDDNYWRRSPSPQTSLKCKVDFHGVTIQGFVYFLARHCFASFDAIVHTHDIERYMNMKFVVSFDLGKEQWRPTTLQGPGINTGKGTCQTKLVKLCNTLVVVHNNSNGSTIDLWFAENLEKGLWVKKNCVPQELLAPMSLDTIFCIPKRVNFLMELEDGRIIFCYYVTWTKEQGSRWRTRVYDPRTYACTDLPQLDLCDIVGVYIESLLYLVNE
jgi:hypothetical protein